MVKKMLKTVRNKWSKPVWVWKASPLSSAEMFEFVLKLSEGSLFKVRSAAMFLLQFNLMAGFDNIKFIIVMEVKLLQFADLEVYIKKTKSYNSFEA